MDLSYQRRIAASLLKCGENRVWMDSDRIEEISKAVTREDIKKLINGGAIKSKQANGISSGRKKYLQRQKEKGKRKGPGSRKGAKNARFPRKRRWIKTVRPLRSYLRQLRDNDKITPTEYRKYYRKVKGGEFKSKDHLNTHLIADGVISKEEEK